MGEFFCRGFAMLTVLKKGSYTFAKTLEYKAKQNIQKEVTVIPPKEYRDRFVRAVNSYFVACPGRSYKPLLKHTSFLR